MVFITICSKLLDPPVKGHQKTKEQLEEIERERLREMNEEKKTNWCVLLVIMAIVDLAALVFLMMLNCFTYNTYNLIVGVLLSLFIFLDVSVLFVAFFYPRPHPTRRFFLLKFSIFQFVAVCINLALAANLIFIYVTLPECNDEACSMSGLYVVAAIVMGLCALWRYAFSATARQVASIPDPVEVPKVEPVFVFPNKASPAYSLPTAYKNDNNNYNNLNYYNNTVVSFEFPHVDTSV